MTWLLIPILFLIGGADNNKIIEDYLRANLLGYANFEYRILNARNIENADFTIDYGREFKLKNHYGYIPVIIKDGKYTRNTFVTVNLKLYQKALVASRRIRRSEKISRADFQLRICDVTNLRGKAVSDFSLIKNSRMRVNLRVGEILTEEMLEKNDDVYAGEKVTAIYSNGTVAVSFPAIVRRGGKRGEIIRVQRKDGIIFKAKVINKNEVTILE